MKQRRKMAKNRPSRRPESMWVAYASIWGFVFTVLALMLGAMLIRNRNVNARRLDQRLSRWEGKYELTKEQIARIREIEVGFHGRSNLIWTARRTAEEMQRHNAEIAAKMSAPAAERFLKAEEAHRK